MKTPASFLRSLPLLRSALASLLAALCVSFASAQTTTGRITGIVTNSSGNAYLEGATVSIDGSNRMTTTDRRGEFDFGGMPPGEYVLRVAYTGMAPASIRAVVTASLTASVTVPLGEDVVKMGDSITVKCIGIDEKSGKVRLSRKAALKDLEGPGIDGLFTRKAARA